MHIRFFLLLLACGVGGFSASAAVAVQQGPGQGPVKAVPQAERKNKPERVSDDHDPTETARSARGSRPERSARGARGHEAGARGARGNAGGRSMGGGHGRGH